ncbi:MAG: SBBP repeat-containing protein, partial [Candidatus Zixiibacteriota bacterium]
MRKVPMPKHGMFIPIIGAAVSAFVPLAASTEMIVDTAWVRYHDGPGSARDWARDMALDSSGNVYVTGESYGDTTFDDYATVKYHPNGNVAWAKRYNGPGNAGDRAYAIAVDSHGNVYVTGESWSGGTGFDYATVKYHPGGDTAWVRRYNGPGNENDAARVAAVDDSGYLYVTGWSYGDGTYSDFATIKYSTDGDTAWVRRYNGPENGSDYPHAIAVDASGNTYVTGYSTAGSMYDYDYVTIKYSSKGDTAWVRRYDGSGNGSDYAYAIALDVSGNVYVTGESMGSGIEPDYLTIKYDPQGEIDWAARHDGPAQWWDAAYAVAVDGSLNVYVTGGSFRSLVDADYTTLKYRHNGDTAWVRRYGGSP